MGLRAIVLELLIANGRKTMEELAEASAEARGVSAAHFNGAEIGFQAKDGAVEQRAFDFVGVGEIDDGGAMDAGERMIGETRGPLLQRHLNENILAAGGLDFGIVAGGFDADDGTKSYDAGLAGGIQDDEIALIAGSGLLRETRLEIVNGIGEAFCANAGLVSTLMRFEGVAPDANGNVSGAAGEEDGDLFDGVARIAEEAPIGERQATQWIRADTEGDKPEIAERNGSQHGHRDRPASRG